MGTLYDFFNIYVITIETVNVSVLLFMYVLVQRSIIGPNID